MCCSVLQARFHLSVAKKPQFPPAMVLSIAVCCSVLHLKWYCLQGYVAVCCNVLQSVVAVCCNVLQSVAVECVAVCCTLIGTAGRGMLQCVEVCGSVWQCVAVCCGGVCCSALHPMW